MKQRSALLAMVLLAAPASAQEKDGLGLMGEGARLFFEGLMSEMEPALDGLEDMARDIEPFMRDFAAEMGPALRGLMDEVEDWSAYSPPEILPNGDIILRRKAEEEEEEETQEPDPVNPDGTADL